MRHGEQLLHFGFCRIYNIILSKLMLLAFCSHKKIGRDGKGSFCKSCLVEDNALEMLVHHDKILAQICLIS